MERFEVFLGWMFNTVLGYIFFHILWGNVGFLILALIWDRAIYSMFMLGVITMVTMFSIIKKRNGEFESDGTEPFVKAYKWVVERWSKRPRE